MIERNEIAWLEPIADSALGDVNDPAVMVVNRDSVRLALVAALQHLSARQRAVLVLRDVLQWKASEVAEALDTTTTAVNSLLQRARAQINHIGPTEDDLVEPTTEAARKLLRDYVHSFESYDVEAIVELFTREAIWEMPPFEGWYQGPEQSGNSSEPNARPTDQERCAYFRPLRTVSRRSASTCASPMVFTALSSCTFSMSPSPGSRTSRVSSI